jgi:hypothetical protein
MRVEIRAKVNQNHGVVLGRQGVEAALPCEKPEARREWVSTSADSFALIARGDIKLQVVDKPFQVEQIGENDDKKRTCG